MKIPPRRLRTTARRLSPLLVGRSCFRGSVRCCPLVICVLLTDSSLVPGKKVSYNTSTYEYRTSTNASAPKVHPFAPLSSPHTLTHTFSQFAAWISQLNLTYTELYDINGTTAKTKQPGGELYGPNTFPVLNGTQFVLVVDADPYLTPFNLSYLNSHVVAGPSMYQSG